MVFPIIFSHFAITRLDKTAAMIMVEKVVYRLSSIHGRAYDFLVFFFRYGVVFARSAAVLL
jgi:hypothetical protein